MYLYYIINQKNARKKGKLTKKVDELHKNLIIFTKKKDGNFNEKCKKD